MEENVKYCYLLLATFFNDKKSDEQVNIVLLLSSPYL